MRWKLYCLPVGEHDLDDAMTSTVYLHRNRKSTEYLLSSGVLIKILKVSSNFADAVLEGMKYECLEWLSERSD